MNALCHSNASACSNEIPCVAMFRAFFAASKLMSTHIVYIRIYTNSSCEPSIVPIAAPTNTPEEIIDADHAAYFPAAPLLKDSRIESAQ